VTKGAPGGAPGALQILDDATHLLRRAGAAPLLAFQAGSIPFVLGFVYFWTDMRTSAFGWEQAGTSSAAVAGLYVWMKCWQAVGARWLRARLAGDGPGAGAPPAAPGMVRTCVTQAAWQPLSLFALPAAALLTAPYGWVYAFFQGVTVTGESARARRHAMLWPGQNHVLIAVLSLFGFVVFVNVATAVLLAPALLKSLLGVETVFSRSPWWAMVNSTFFLIAAGITYLVVAPLSRTAYVLRAFHADSLRSGEDLRLDLRRLSRPARRAAAILLALAAGISAGNAGAGPATGWDAAPAAGAAPRGAGVPGARVAPAELERAIAEVIGRREFRWRLPREEPPASERSVVLRFLDNVTDTIAGWIRSAAEAVGRLVRWLAERFAPRGDLDLPWIGARRDYTTMVQWLLGGLLLLAGGLAGLALWRARRRRRGRVQAAVAIVPAALPEHESEADRAAPDDWLARAQELLDRGDLRQAVRAIYLSVLSYLARSGLIGLARHKSNHEYLAEVARRARARPEAAALFSEAVSVFDKTWYGCFEPDRDAVLSYGSTCQRLTSDAGR
jgi:hypothetical protein